MLSHVHIHSSCRCHLCDFSAVVAVDAVKGRYALQNKVCTFQNMQSKSIRRMQNAGFDMNAYGESSQAGPLRMSSRAIQSTLYVPPLFYCAFF